MSLCRELQRKTGRITNGKGRLADEAKRAIRDHLDGLLIQMAEKHLYSGRLTPNRSARRPQSLPTVISAWPAPP